MKLKDLIRQLTVIQDAHGGSKEVKVWLPGSTISLSSAFLHKDVVKIEGNVDAGSALDTESRLLGASDEPDLLRLLRELVRSDILGATTYMLLQHDTLRDIITQAKSMLEIEEREKKSINAELRAEYLRHITTLESAFRDFK